MSATAGINAINLQVWAEDQVALDRLAGTYDANRAADSRYYLWHSEFQTIPLGMDGNPEQFAARLREALPLVNTLRLPFNQYSFDETGALHEQYERFLHAAAEQGFQVIFVYAGGDAQRYGAEGGVDADQIHEALSGDIYAGMEGAWGAMMDWLDANPDVADAVWGCELVNEPATYARGADLDGAAGGDRFLELYARQMAALADLIDARTDARILVGGWRYSARFDELEAGNLGGLSAIDYLRAQIGDDLVWSSHLYPGWAGTGAAETSDALDALLAAHYAALGADDVLITETNANGALADNPAERDGATFLFARSYEWLAEQGIGGTWFPGVETGGSNFVVIDPDGGLRYLHANSLAHGLNLYSLDERPAEHAGDEVIVTDIVAGRVRNEAYQAPALQFDAVQGVGFGFGYDGNDVILGHDDTNDFAYGGHGADVLRGLGGDDHLYGQYGSDTLDGGAGADHLFGGDGDDVLDGGAGDDQLNGQAGADDFVIGSGGADTIVDFRISEGDRLIFEGSVLDPVQLAQIGARLDATGIGRADDLQVMLRDGSVTLLDFFALNPGIEVGPGGGDVPATWETLGIGPAGPPSVILDVGNDRFRGGDDAELIDGSAGDDSIYGGGGDDTILGGEGQDTLFADLGHDTLIGGAGDDMLVLSRSASTADGGDGDDTFVLSLVRGAGHVVTGGGGADRFDLIGATYERAALVTIRDFEIGTDLLSIDGVPLAAAVAQGLAAGTLGFLAMSDGVIMTFDTANTVYFQGMDFADLALHLGIAPHVAASLSDEDRLTQVFVGIDGHAASQVSDFLIGTEGADTILGGAGDDTIVGDAGDDVIRGGTGNDLISARGGADTVDGGAGNDEIFGNSGHNSLFGGAGNDTIASGRHDSLLDGGAGDDLLALDLSSGGNHRATGGAGADVFDFGRNRADRHSETVVHDFTLGEDGLRFDGVAGAQYLARQGDAVQLAEISGGLRLTLADGDTILFEGVDLAGFSAEFLI
ncbi:calcium-binding protein [Phaeovulum vinaykumarii]|uniref:Ca2+-binding protein, RTX toxin-related n=1 Tax=Phaeovulum vinaykumarii TaxID=407234 RepID=A0A1N7LTQ2_9RHOB|nr:calcium-binding protein [Phaeovulum vinaykumarii]SIS77152.1 Ca2+-binding protein, RTX toxin-related [Phaeovulum vinaykumarii]SOC07568.1 Ca2+-binding RTX toxin-like protein [Phaeovulum vinaykumarii]